ncbi:probable very-long-chain enoyl-CoA reductase art-1 [Parasteatoda tepidariorum]|uniref:probable very-long-chain enoyl-CoA reductase art-1 n=1 Tax=Parasteatoda tepidariorum TaxID=114398 RepID=UPI00077F9F2F|nr:probable very-long-chain enoyl-CoA reductase art-1 [Parasteatoda tepidariorum]
MEVEILQSGSGKVVAHLSDLSPASTVYDVKKEIHKLKKKLHPSRQALKLDQRGKFLNDGLTLDSVEFKGQKQLYLKDLGPQIGWKTVFLLEYAGPLVLYVLTYCRPAILYGADASKKMHPVIHIAVVCWVIHYSKRLLETLFVHRFSHATMPFGNLFKNCSYYWLFGLYIGYYCNHPLYTPPSYGDVQIYGALATFIIAELGNLSIHLALRNLRPPGTTERKIPVPTGNPLTSLFNFVSCPNYTYEYLAWLSFTLMTQTLPAGLFTLAGLYQMSVWALGKHRNYKKEFPNYPRGRKAIIPFLL